MLHEEFNKLTNTLKREEQQSSDQYPWLAGDDESRNLTDREILEKYIDLGDFVLNPERKGRVN